jgi:hypothetical protein
MKKFFFSLSFPHCDAIEPTKALSLSFNCQVWTSSVVLENGMQAKKKKGEIHSLYF